ncbi:MAG TPA: 1-deoxy-D-xylulose-5-phosphate reductoisomerase [Alphaproteobacteria bacterium]|jgi:1-deoxy-D-xylulose-5-phosphate reductoisomerase|nr:1-deoxy-D-xylulose-5-phosphate reductoisomerase [Alphaproteobacteria bacterium]MCB9984978.1 1-deoxy-D-xylulose-5-phosphate reductoisomerase [Micavibrio sp.]HRK97369.1 1-deoxy-D-xylulose-5-phosphate reductoisomerase [Alphaproteobacteria bacterium]
MEQKSISILGSTGSIGTSTIDLISQNPEQFKIRVLTAGRNLNLLIEQAKKFAPEFIAIADETLYQQLKDALSTTSIKIAAGRSAILEAASIPTDICMAAIVGIAGLEPVLTAIPHTKSLAIANKEPLVAAGKLVLDLAKQHGTNILPVDSEHNAIFQVFENHNRTQIKKIILTASGGPFRTWTKEQIAMATPEQAVNHPNWIMGRKISVDSASMMNKALEIIEAHYLFDIPANQIDVLIHPQSIIHSMVEYTDGSVLAQLGAPDMRTPIAYALAYPDRMTTTGKTLDWTTLSKLEFQQPDFNQFPSLGLAYDCLKSGQSACIALNAANEIAVEKFLNKEISFGQIIPILEKSIPHAQGRTVSSLEDIIALNQEIRIRSHL